MAVPQVTNLPTAPSRSDSPDVFAQRADAFVAALVGWNASINDATDWANLQFQEIQSVADDAANVTEAVPKVNTFLSRWLGELANDPSVDYFGNPVTAGTTYFNTSFNRVRIYNGSDWQDAVGAITGDFTIIRETLTATSGQTVFTVANQYTTGINSLMVYVNGARVLDSDYTETDSNTIIFSTGLNAGDEVLIEQGVTNTGDTTSAGLTTLNPVGTITSTNVQAGFEEIDQRFGNVDQQLASTDPTKGTLTQSFLAGQQESITLSDPLTDAAIVSVTKEVPQIGVTTDDWDVRVSGANYDVEDTAYATTLTPSANTGNITLTLGAGAFTASDVGKTISGNGGVAVLVAADGGATVEQAFNGTSAIDSGEWKMKALVFNQSNVEVSSGEDGYHIDNASYDGVSLDVSGQVSMLTDIAFNNDGTKLYALDAGSDSVYQYTLTTAFDLSTASYDSVSFSVYSEDMVPSGLVFSNDGMKMFVLGADTDTIYQYTLSSSFDISTASYYSVNLNVTAQDDNSEGIFFSNDGTKLYMAGRRNDSIYQYTLTTAFDLSTASYDSVSFNVSGQESNPYAMAFDNKGTKMFVIMQSVNDYVYQYTLTTAFDLSTASYDGVRLYVSGRDTAPEGLVFSNYGKKMFVGGENTNSVYQYSSFNPASPTTQHLPAITNAGGQIDSTFWTDINSAFSTDTPNGQTINYAFSTDGRMTFTVVRENEGARNIVRNNAGTWEINTSTTYSAETWTAASKNDVWGALSEAMGTIANAMPSTQLAAATDADFPATGDTLDLAIILYTDDATQIPSSQGATLNYDANVLNQGAINGTDYEWDQPSDTEVRIKALKAGNYKARVV